MQEENYPQLHEDNVGTSQSFEVPSSKVEKAMRYLQVSLLG